MKERLTIHKFAGISNIELEFDDINILIGPQATGKSICAKSLYYFKSFTSELLSSVRNNKTISEFNNLFIEKFKEFFPPQSWPSSFSIKYELFSAGGETLFVQVKKPAKPSSSIRLTYSEYYKTLYKRLYERVASFKKDSSHEGQSRPNLFIKEYELFHEIQDSIREEIGPLGYQPQIFIPAGRSFFGILQSSIFTFLATNTAIDPFLKSFGSFLETTKSIDSGYFLMPPNKNWKKISPVKEQVDKLIQSILKGKYIYENDKDYLLFQDGRKTLLANASSGQQETLPLALILKRFVTFYWKEGYTIYIEEPEAHIFPTAQKEIVQLISLIYNLYRPERPYQFVITTHSPYILTAFNNLLFAGILERKLPKKKKDELYKVVSREQILDPDQIKCYSLNHSTCQSILSKTTGLITSDVIDSVSDEFAIQFGNLLDLDTE